MKCGGNGIVIIMCIHLCLQNLWKTMDIGAQLNELLVYNYTGAYFIYLDAINTALF